MSDPSTSGGERYFEARALDRTAGPWLLWGLGVGYVISGDYFGWNFGLRAGGFGGLALGTALMAAMYLAMIFCIAEMATALPVAGGPYAFARRALGPWGGYITGLAVTIEYVLAPAVIAAGIGGYVAGMFADPSPALQVLVQIGTYAVFIAISAFGSRTSLRLLLAVTAVSVLAVLVWAIAMVPHVRLERLFDIPSDPGEPSWRPHGWQGVIAALPAAGWFYLAVEGIPLAAEETRDPARSLPRGMIAAMLSLMALSAIVLVIAPGVTGAAALGTAGNPLPLAAEVALGRGAIYWLTTLIGLAGLVASFFSIVFAYSRQVFALSRAGYFPRWLSKTNRHHAPHWALIVPGVLGYGAILVVDAINPGRVPTADLLMQMAVFAALVSYVTMMVSHIVLRRRHPDLPRPYRTPGYPFTPLLALGLALLALSSSLFYGEAATFAVASTASIFAVGMLYFALYSRHHLVADAPEEEAALVRQAERDLDA